MGYWKREFKIEGLKCDINPAPKASLQRRVQRYNRVQEAQKRAIKRGDTRRAAQLEEELDALAGNLLEERAAIEAMLGDN